MALSAPARTRPLRQAHRLPGVALTVALTTTLMTALLTVLVQPTASAAEATTTLTLQAPATAYVDTDVTVTATLVRDDTAQPVAGVEVAVHRRVDGAWKRISTTTTDVEGRAEATFRVQPRRAANELRAVFAGTAELAASTSEDVVVEPRRRSSTVVVNGPTRIVDETKETLRFRWTADGAPVPGQGVVWSRQGGATWKRAGKVSFNQHGKARMRVAPRVDSRWKVVGKQGRWWEGATSSVHRLDNVPPGAPVAYPKQAPRPRVRLPRQQRAVGAGANVKVSRIPNKIWRSMNGRSWHRGCPVGRSQLRLVRVNYWGYDGYRYRGELVVRTAITGKTGRAFAALYRAELPIRSMYRVDRFGWSGKLGGADNYRSMASGNTSAFNCRGVVGNPGVRSPHSYGRAIDINTWENPYHSRTGIVPNTWWASRSHPKIAWRSGAHRVVSIMRANGFRWTYGTSDAHHFDG